MSLSAISATEPSERHSTVIRRSSRSYRLAPVASSSSTTRTRSAPTGPAFWPEAPLAVAGRLGGFGRKARRQTSYEPLDMAAAFRQKPQARSHTGQRQSEGCVDAPPGLGANARRGHDLAARVEHFNRLPRSVAVQPRRSHQGGAEDDPRQIDARSPHSADCELRREWNRSRPRECLTRSALSGRATPVARALNSLSHLEALRPIEARQRRSRDPRGDAYAGLRSLGTARRPQAG